MLGRINKGRMIEAGFKQFHRVDLRGHNKSAEIQPPVT